MLTFAWRHLLNSATMSDKLRRSSHSSPALMASASPPAAAMRSCSFCPHNEFSSSSARSSGAMPARCSSGEKRASRAARCATGTCTSATRRAPSVATSDAPHAPSVSADGSARFHPSALLEAAAGSGCCLFQAALATSSLAGGGG